MISCGIQSETRALGQAQQALERYLAALYPTYESTWTRPDVSLDVEDLEDEEEEEKPDEQDNNTSRKDRRFQAVDTASGGLIFYRFRINIKPTNFIDTMIEHLINKKKDQEKEVEKELALINHCHRFVPLDYICPVTTERISTCFINRVIPECLASLPANTTVAILTELRNNISITKQEIIAIIAPTLPTHLKVDLKNPDYVIFVTIFKSVCGISVLKDYYKKKKYNISALI
ncbi:uncharacterized protein BX664DRAFT_366190 [Halteromyces radiatus]|uniref:uncharacterized protein n=1 Tax=Halteromyces radiatus TaxID=101107 RepID=UPI0022206A4A|nr:uncharacterized protein BX664DRAFT_366190 [Halteromyces radiatus]KAI8084474.1 hypothetical protein BX664DRAFT_366190 [Halteromyces radiatus]